MAEHLRALVVVTVLGLGYFYAAGSALSQLLPQETFKRWRNWWLLVTLALFLSHGVWLYTLVLGAVLLAYRRRETYLVGLYFVLLLAAPPVPAVIPGFGIIEHLWVLDHYRLLAVTLLLPTAIALLQRSDRVRLGASPVDWMLLGYLLLMSLLTFREGNVTSGLRNVWSLWVDIFLPYYVVSRSIRSEEGLKHAMAGFVMAAMILSLVAVFEVLRSWKLYSGVLEALGVNPRLFGGYLERSGLVRPSASVGNSIVLGFVLVVALGFFFYLKEYLVKPRYRIFGVAILVTGIVASLSRGPWGGAAFLVVVYFMVSPRPIKRLALLVLGAGVSIGLLSLLPQGQRMIEMLPFMGTEEQFNVEYRANLLTQALPVIERNLLFGAHDFLRAPELQVMIQGEGIIDVVNAYIGVALYSGLIGLALFLGAFLFALHQLRKGLRWVRHIDPRLAILGRALFATVLAVMLIIYTVSSIIAIPVVYWAVLGLCVAYVNVAIERARRNHKAVAT